MENLRPSPVVYGIETEYSCMLGLPDSTVYEIVGQCHSLDSELGLYQEPSGKGFNHVSDDSIRAGLVSQGIYSNKHGMLSNGGRFYIDPSGPEYDTPETTTAEEVVHRTFDGDEIMLSALRYLQQKDCIESFQLNRRIVDHNRSSRGIHLNTTTVLPLEPTKELTGYLATLNLAKGSIFGSGGLLVDETGETAYHHSPRLSLTTDIAAHYNNYRQRPLVRYPFKSDGNYSRIETVTSDALNFAWPLRASMVISNAVSSLIEIDYSHELPVAWYPDQKAREVGQFGNDCEILIDTGNTEALSVKPLDIIRQISELALEVDAREEILDQESKQVLPEIIEVADKMTNDLYSVADQVESVGRLVAMELKMAKDKIDLSSEKMCRFDYAWDWLGGGIAERLRHKGVVGWQGFKEKHSPTTMKKRIVTAPTDTRASIRGELIGKNRGHNLSLWTDIEVDDETVFIDPLDTQIPPIDQST